MDYEACGGFHEWVPPIWMVFVLENPIKVDDLGVPLSETLIRRKGKPFIRSTMLWDVQPFIRHWLVPQVPILGVLGKRSNLW